MRDRRPEVYGEILRREEKILTTEHAESTEKI
jgi:hypothetical protein